MRIAVVSCWNRQVSDLASLVLPNRQAYCRRHGYEECFEESQETHGRHPHWLKVFALQKHLPYWDWLFWIDLDCLIMETAVPLDLFTDTKADLMFACDCKGINAGVLMFRNSEWSRCFVDHWWDTECCYSESTNPEQTTLAHTLWREPKEKWQVVPQRSFNSYGRRCYYHDRKNQPCPGQYQRGDFIMHGVGWNHQERLRNFADVLSARTEKEN